MSNSEQQQLDPNEQQSENAKDKGGVEFQMYRELFNELGDDTYNPLEIYLLLQIKLKELYRDYQIKMNAGDAKTFKQHSASVETFRESKTCSEVTVRVGAMLNPNCLRDMEKAILFSEIKKDNMTDNKNTYGDGMQCLLEQKNRLEKRLETQEELEDRAGVDLEDSLTAIHKKIFSLKCDVVKKLWGKEISQDKVEELVRNDAIDDFEAMRKARGEALKGAFDKKILEFERGESDKKSQLCTEIKKIQSELRIIDREDARVNKTVAEEIDPKNSNSEVKTQTSQDASKSSEAFESGDAKKKGDEKSEPKKLEESDEGEQAEFQKFLILLKRIYQDGESRNNKNRKESAINMLLAEKAALENRVKKSKITQEELQKYSLRIRALDALYDEWRKPPTSVEDKKEDAGESEDEKNIEEYEKYIRDYISVIEQKYEEAKENGDTDGMKRIISNISEEIQKQEDFLKKGEKTLSKEYIVAMGNGRLLLGNLRNKLKADLSSVKSKEPEETEKAGPVDEKKSKKPGREGAGIDLRTMESRQRDVKFLLYKATERGYDLDQAKEKRQAALKKANTEDERDEIRLQINKIQKEILDLKGTVFKEKFIDGEFLRVDLSNSVEEKLNLRSSDAEKAIDMFFARVAMGGSYNKNFLSKLPWGIGTVYEGVVGVFGPGKEELDHRFDAVRDALYKILDEDMHLLEGDTLDEKRQSFNEFVRSMVKDIEPTLQEEAMGRKKWITTESTVKAILTTALVGSAFTSGAIIAVPALSLASYGYGKFANWRREIAKKKGLDADQIEKRKRKVSKDKECLRQLTDMFFQKIGDRYESGLMEKSGVDKGASLNINEINKYIEKAYGWASDGEKANVKALLIGGSVLLETDNKLLEAMIEKNKGVENRIEDFDKDINNREKNFLLDRVPFIARWVTFGAIASKDTIVSGVLGSNYTEYVPLLRAVMGGIAGYKLSDRLGIAVARMAVRRGIRGLDAPIVKAIKEIGELRSQEDVESALDSDTGLGILLREPSKRANFKDFVLSQIADISRKKNMRAEDYGALEENKRILEILNRAEARNHKNIKESIEKVVGESNRCEEALKSLYYTLEQRNEILKAYSKDREKKIEEVVADKKDSFESKIGWIRTVGSVIGVLAPFLVRELLGSDARAGGSEEVQGARAPTSLEHKTDSGVVEAGDVEVRSTLQPESNANDNSSEVKASTTQKPEAPKPGEGQIDVKDATPKPSSGGELLGSSNGSASTDAVRGGGMLTTEDESSVSWDSVDQNAIIRKNEGVWHAIKRQIQADPEIRRALNLSNNPSNDEINRATAKLLVQHEYIKPDGSEVRVLKADVVAYDAKVMDGKVVINELHSVDGKVAKGTTGIDKAFEYSYKKPVNESFGGSDLRDIGYDLEEVGMIENKQGNIIVGLDTDGESDSLLIYGVQKGEVSRLELSDGIGVEDEFMVADRIKSFSDMDSANEFIDQVRESGYVSGEMPVKLSELSSEQMRVFESAYNLQGFDGIGTRFSIERDVLMEFAKNYNGKTVEIMRMIEGDMGVPQGSEKLIQAARAVLAERIQNQGAGYQDLAQGMMIDEINEKGLISFLNDNYTGQKLMTPDEFDLPMSSMESAGNIAGPILDIGSPESSNVTEPVVASGGEPNLPSKSYDMIKQVFDIGDRAMNKMLSSTESFDNSLSQIGDTELKENISDSLKKFQERGRVISELEGQRLGGIPGAEDFKTISDVSDKPAREVYKSLFNLMEQEKELDQFLKQNDKEGFTRKIN